MSSRQHALSSRDLREEHVCVSDTWLYRKIKFMRMICCFDSDNEKTIHQLYMMRMRLTTWLVFKMTEGKNNFVNTFTGLGETKIKEEKKPT
jgi:hypothetical protein